MVLGIILVSILALTVTVISVLLTVGTFWGVYSLLLKVIPDVSHEIVAVTAIPITFVNYFMMVKFGFDIIKGINTKFPDSALAEGPESRDTRPVGGHGYYREEAGYDDEEEDDDVEVIPSIRARLRGDSSVSPPPSSAVKPGRTTKH